MLSRHRVSRAAIELLKRFEGYRRHAAQLPDGRWTLGYGHTLTAREDAEVTESDAEALLVYDLISVQHAVNENVYAPISQNQFDALCSFAFNIGIDNFRRSQVLKRLNAGAAVQAACAMELWRKADFEGERIVVDALVRRRASEKALFLTPAGDAWIPAPSPLLRPIIDLDALDLVPLRRPVELETSMEGPKVTVRRENPPESALFAEPEPEPTPEPIAAITAAAESVAARLESIFPDPGEERELFVEPEPELAPVEAVPPAAEALAEPLTDVRPQADFAAPISASADTREPEAPIEPPAPAPVVESVDLGLEPEPADAELDIPQAPIFQRFDRQQPQVAMDVGPFEFIPSRPRPTPQPREASIVWDLLLVLLGLAFLGFGVFWGLSARPASAVGVIAPIMVAWPAALAGVLFTVVAVYRLLQRLGREAERD